MKQCKIIKLPNYHCVYAVYVASSPDWVEVGRIVHNGESDSELIELAKELVRPRTIYFDA